MPEPVDTALYRTWDCGDMRYALYDADAYIEWANQGGLQGASSEAVKRNASVSGSFPPAIPIILGFLAAEGARGQAGAVAALAHAKGKALALHRAMQEKACTEWPQGAGKQVIQFACTLRVRDPASGDSGQFIPSESGGSPVRLVLFERAIQFSDLSESPPNAESITPAQVLNVYRSSLADTTGNFALVYRSTYPVGIGVGFRDRYQLRADDCGPMTEEEVARANVVLQSWFESLAR
jgi:hypothetical protein